MDPWTEGQNDCGLIAKQAFKYRTVVGDRYMIEGKNGNLQKKYNPQILDRNIRVVN